MGKDKKGAKDKQAQPSEGRPINFRSPPDLSARLDYVAKRLGLDVSNLIRMILYENLAQYEERAKQIDREDQK